MYAENLISTPEAQADFYPTPRNWEKECCRTLTLDLSQRF